MSPLRWIALALLVAFLVGCGEVQKPPPHVIAASAVEAQILAKRGHANRPRSTVRAPKSNASGTPSSSGWRTVVVGHSVRGRAIRAAVGGPDGGRRVLVVGCIHGNERAGEAITRRLETGPPPADAQLWVVDTFNPDGCAAGTRQNADRVDLNRNSPWQWRPLDQPGGTYYSGPRPLSEPESRAINKLIVRLQPDVTVWYHQHATLVDASGGDPAIERRYAQIVGLPFRAYGFEPGSITTWQNTAFPTDTAFCVELPAGTLDAASVARHVAAIRWIERAARS